MMRMLMMMMMMMMMMMLMMTMMMMMMMMMMMPLLLLLLLLLLMMMMMTMMPNSPAGPKPRTTPRGGGEPLQADPTPNHTTPQTTKREQHHGDHNVSVSDLRWLTLRKPIAWFPGMAGSCGPSKDCKSDWNRFFAKCSTLQSIGES